MPSLPTQPSFRNAPSRESIQMDVRSHESTQIAKPRGALECDEASIAQLLQGVSVFQNLYKRQSQIRQITDGRT
jgi:hypothetical protein